MHALYYVLCFNLYEYQFCIRVTDYKLSGAIIYRSLFQIHRIIASLQIMIRTGCTSYIYLLFIKLRHLQQQTSGRVTTTVYTPITLGPLRIAKF
jgi:hypothetical protein